MGELIKTIAADPRTGTAIKGAGIGLGVAGAIQEGRAAEAESKSAQNLAEFNARVQEREATAIKQKSVFESKRAATAAAERRSAQKASIATAGGLGSPVATDLAAEQAAEDELEQLLISFEGQTGVGRARSQAAIDRAGGRIAKRRGESLKTASRIKAGTSLLTGF